MAVTMDQLTHLQEALDRAQEAKEKEEQLLHGNPLVNPNGIATPDFTIKKRSVRRSAIIRTRNADRPNVYCSLAHTSLRWYDDTVFKNQARGEVKQQKRFINDTIRNDFHKKFLQRYIK